MNQYWVKIENGAIVWNSKDASSHDGEAGWASLPVGEIDADLKASDDGLSVVVDEPKKKRRLNLEAKLAFTILKKAESDSAEVQALGDKTETLVLAQMLFCVVGYVKSIQAAANIADASLSSDGQANLQSINDAVASIYNPIIQARSAREAAIAAFTPPNTDVDPLYP